MVKQKVRFISFYLPQYHPIPENDRWWGKGFTEWRNVTQAKPRFLGHYQPHLPRDLGFYDLRLAETRQAQADLARSYGIGGFCYYHYWFNGKRLLERPFQAVLASGQPDFPFCLCWANENWTRRWDGKGQDVLLQQNYGEADDRAHIQSLLPAFQDPRYICIDGKPLFLVYRANHLPHPCHTTTLWRQEAQQAGIGDLFLGRVESTGDEQTDPRELGFDGAIEFQPDWANLGPDLRQGRGWRGLRKLGLSSPAYGENRIFDYGTIVDRQLNKPQPDYLRFPCVTPAWDNTARRPQGKALIFKGSTPELYEKWLKGACQRVLHQAEKNQAGENRENQEQIVFINAWNEWAEGNHLEPCQKWGHGYLAATKRVWEKR
jgi:lipopolysaccharide biosynthesis protein